MLKNKNQNIVVRTDSSSLIGTGHLVRCLTLADKLAQEGVKINFICYDLPGNICHLIEKKNYKVYRIQNQENTSNNDKTLNTSHDWAEDAEQTKKILDRIENKTDCLIVDHYGLDEKWEKELKSYVKRIMAIDDLANRHHQCDLLLDQNFYEEAEGRYKKLILNDCQKLLGPKFALLRPEFKTNREKLKKRNGNTHRILIFFGGSDPTNETTKALEAVHLLNEPNIIVDVVVGSSNKNQEEVKKLCQIISNCNFHLQIENMADLMAKADLAIGAGGTTTWERCCLGLPAVVSILSDNQYELTKAVAKHGAVLNLGWAKNITPESYVTTIKGLTPQKLIEMGEQGMKLVDGDGSYRVVDALFQLN